MSLSRTFLQSTIEICEYTEKKETISGISKTHEIAKYQIRMIHTLTNEFSVAMLKTLSSMTNYVVVTVACSFMQGVFDAAVEVKIPKTG